MIRRLSQESPTAPMSTATPLPLRFYNTLTRSLETFEPMDAAQVRLYVCGPTVYDEAHLGHARCYLTWDMLVRLLQLAGYGVRYVRNVTDVDDKILARAAQNNEPPEALALRFTERFHQVLGQLNTLPPTDEPRATAYVPQMIAFIDRLIETGAAYATPSGTVYYNIAQKADYGALCHQDLDQLQSGARVDVDPEKQSPLDFALWKPASAGEPLVWATPSHWGGTGWGRPGWHTECSVMSYHQLGEQLDIHAGGMDLIFPHHQNEIAQSEAFTGKRYVKYWLHNGFVNVSGEKMSKSLGNFATIESMLARYDANTVRYFILTHHYRSPVDFNETAIASAEARIQKMMNGLSQIEAALGASLDGLTSQASTLVQTHLHQATDGALQDNLGRWFAALADDMNTAVALAEVNELYRQLMSAEPSQWQAWAAESVLNPLWAFLGAWHHLGFTASLPVDLSPLKSDLAALLAQYNLPHAETEALAIDSLLAYRVEARLNKQWAVSDQIRDALQALGLKLQDQKDGPARWTYSPAAKTQIEA